MKKCRISLREILISAVFIGTIGGLFVLNIAVPKPAVLASERRLPAKFPDVKLSAILSAGFMHKFEDYAADNFVFRDGFRALHSFTVLDILRQTDKSGLYRSKNVGLGEFRRTDAASFRQSAEKIKKAADSCGAQSLHIYYAIVPDKSVYAENYMPGFDLAEAESILLDVLGGYTYIPLADTLQAESFYRTDLHWNQSMISGAANHLLDGMGAAANAAAFPIVTGGDFRGVYAGQLALPTPADVLRYEDVPGLRVHYLDEKTLRFEPGPVYDSGRFSGIDPYDMFLRGPQPLIIIENDAAPQRALYLFRDSFGSSLAPLLTTAYSSITVIDLRYIHLSLLNQFVDFIPGSDALFLYSSQIFNNPSVLQT